MTYKTHTIPSNTVHLSHSMRIAFSSHLPQGAATSLGRQPSSQKTRATIETIIDTKQEREAWVSSVRNMTGRNKHRVWSDVSTLLNPPPLLSDVTVILVSPKRPSSIGAVARALSCFECIDLRIVAPRCDHLARSAKNGSKGAQYLLWKATMYNTVQDALEGCTASVAFTRWLNGLQGVECFTSLHDLLNSPLIPSHEPDEQHLGNSGGKLALVFGREVEGLLAEEVMACSAVCSIPIGRLQESLSLAHTVSLALAPIYEGRAVKTQQFSTSVADLAAGVEIQDD